MNHPKPAKFAQIYIVDLDIQQRAERREALLSEYNRETGTLQQPDQHRRRTGHFLNLDQIGKRVGLPSTHPGGPRHMFKSYQDATAVVREFGKPDVFVTMTCSPMRDEIQEKIPDENQSAQDRPDVVARVYQVKLAALLKDLNEGVLGRVQARIYVVEFQKRGLPHAHILAILADEDKPRTWEIIDKLLSAELLDPETNPKLYETILTCMIHTVNPSCVCMKDGKCTKGYPKPLAEVTRGNVNGFPVCRRRLRPPDVLKFWGREYDNATINQWFVPYNPYLSQKYNCHINVEVSTTLTAVKYLYKYVYKGSDKAVITIETVRGESRQARMEPNEIIRYLNARYISPVEACMRLLGYAIQGKTHSIVQLTIHLENAQVVTFRSSDNPDRVLTRGRHTMLTRCFELCASEAPEDQIAKTMAYQDIPKEFRWDAKTKRWVRRKQFQAALGRMVHLGEEKEDMIKFKTLKSLNDLLQISGYTVADFDLPQLHDFPALVLDSLMRNNLIRRELEGYDHNTLQAIVDQEDQLNEGQRAIFDEIVQAANDPDQGNKLFFIDGQGELGSRHCFGTS
ncbi:unnamed protein product [Phytophthora fragariaefolia]|uniref:Unnamed protein product n=1 Tax=Phytophthora fragariaefolia TaxID=1490495 RepID=A0A9W7CTF1_9STRA|nr:unnamed protein product [Phytophthora fragariaefolia]